MQACEMELAPRSRFNLELEGKTKLITTNEMRMDLKHAQEQNMANSITGSLRGEFN